MLNVYPEVVTQYQDSNQEHLDRQSDASTDMTLPYALELHSTSLLKITLRFPPNGGISAWQTTEWQTNTITDGILIIDLFMAALWNRTGQYIFALWFLYSFFFFYLFLSSPNLSGH